VRICCEHRAVYEASKLLRIQQRLNPDSTATEASQAAWHSRPPCLNGSLVFSCSSGPLRSAISCLLDGAFPLKKSIVAARQIARRHEHFVALAIGNIVKGYRANASGKDVGETSLLFRFSGTAKPLHSAHDQEKSAPGQSRTPFIHLRCTLS
jgi:hypothetical protein